MDEIKVRAIEARPMPIPLKRPISSALGTYTTVECVAVTLHTDTGPSGFGFTMGLGGSWSGSVARYITDELAPAAHGMDILATEKLWHRMWSPNKARMRGGLGVWALSAVDIAVWDAVGKVAGLPIHALLGGFQDPVPVYGSGGWLDLDDAEMIAECEAFASQGIAAYKYKIGSRRDRQRTELLRKAMGNDFTLLADANQGYDVRGALEAANMLADYGVGWIEEPVLADSVDDLASVAARSPIPTAAGENAYFAWGFREICERRAASYLQPDVARCGGITEFRRVAALADSFRVALSSHLWHELSISLVGAAPSGWAAEYTELLPDDLFTHRFEVENGAIAVPAVAGHGVAFTETAIERWAV